MRCVIVICIFTMLLVFTMSCNVSKGSQDSSWWRAVLVLNNKCDWSFPPKRGWCRHRPWMSENKVKISAFLKPPPNITYKVKLSFFTLHTTTSVLKARSNVNVCRSCLIDYHMMPLSDLWWLFSLHPVGPFRTSINIFPSDMVGRKCSSKNEKKNVFVLRLTAHYSQRHLSFPRAKATSKPLFFFFVFFLQDALCQKQFISCVDVFAVETNESRYLNRNLVSESQTREEKASVENGKGGRDKARDSCRYSMN